MTGTGTHETTTTRQPPIATPPKYCNKGTCSNKADLQVIIVRDSNGRERSGLFHQFGRVNHGRYTLRHGFSFMQWVTRCAACYEVDLKGYNDAG